MKKGYTLIEVIATLVILGIISTIATISFSKIASMQAEANYDKLVSIIESSSEVYADEHDSILNKLSNPGDKCKFSYKLLKDAKIVDSDQKDPRTKQILSDNNYIVVEVLSGYKLKYTFINVDNGETTSVQDCQ